MNYPNHLRDIRIQEGLKTTELSRLSGVSEKTIRDVETGKSAGTPVTKQKILRGLNSNSTKSKVFTFEEVFSKDSNK